MVLEVEVHGTLVYVCLHTVVKHTVQIQQLYRQDFASFSH